MIKLAKARVEGFAESIGKTMIPSEQFLIGKKGGEDDHR